MLVIGLSAYLSTRFLKLWTYFHEILWTDSHCYRKQSLRFLGVVSLSHKIMDSTLYSLPFCFACMSRAEMTEDIHQFPYVVVGLVKFCQNEIVMTFNWPWRQGTTENFKFCGILRWIVPRRLSRFSHFCDKWLHLCIKGDLDIPPNFTQKLRLYRCLVILPTPSCCHWCQKFMTTKDGPEAFSGKTEMRSETLSAKTKTFNISSKTKISRSRLRPCQTLNAFTITHSHRGHPEPICYAILPQFLASFYLITR